MERFSDSDIAALTVCESKEELSYFLSGVTDTLKEMVRQEYLPDRFKGKL